MAETKKEKIKIGKILFTKKLVDGFYRGYLIETKTTTYFLPQSQLYFSVLKTQSENENGVKYFYMGIVNKDGEIEDIEVFPLYVLKEIRKKTQHPYLQDDIDSLFGRIRIEHEIMKKQKL
jgi:hypothetical protein